MTILTECGLQYKETVRKAIKASRPLMALHSIRVSMATICVKAVGRRVYSG